MKTLTSLTAASLTCASMSFAESYNFGMQDLTIPDPNGDRPITGVVWYPTLEQETVKALGNKVWKSYETAPEAEPAPGRYPLVLLSHGMYGNHRNQAWLAQGLVERGYIVAAIDHPGTSTFERDPAHAQALNERPNDISRTIDALTSQPWVAQNMSGEIFVAGHSLGGWTSIALAGGQFSADQYHAFCNSAEADVACKVLQRWDIATTPETSAAMEQDMSDPRVSAFAVFDLGGTQTFTPESLRAIDRPVLVYGAPAGDEEKLNLDIESRALASMLPEESSIYVEPTDLTHFDFMGECTGMGLTILRVVEPNDTYVCKNGRGARAEKHEMIIDQVDAFFSAAADGSPS